MMLCATCGKPLSDNPPLPEGYVVTVKADDGLHHGACWGKPLRAPQLQSLDAIADRLGELYQLIGASDIPSSTQVSLLDEVLAITQAIEDVSGRKEEDRH